MLITYNYFEIIDCFINSRFKVILGQPTKFFFGHSVIKTASFDFSFEKWAILRTNINTHLPRQQFKEFVNIGLYSLADIIESKAGQYQIIISSVPFQVNKAVLLEKIAQLVKDKKLEGITGLRDESDKQGMRVVIEVRRGENTDVILNNLYVHTQLQSVFGINMVALVDGQPRVLNLRQLIEAFLRHRREVVTRRTLFDLRKANERAHILEGLAVALANIDEMIALIKKAKDPAEAKAELMKRTWHSADVITILTRVSAETRYGLSDDGYHLSPEQAQSILDMRLHRLTGLEQDKIVGEHRELQKLIADLNEILGDAKRLMQVIRTELLAIKEQFGDDRRTKIIESEGDFCFEDLVPDEEVVVTLSHEGYTKSQPVALYQAQHRGGKGKSATKPRAIP